MQEQGAVSLEMLGFEERRAERPRGKMVFAQNRTKEIDRKSFVPINAHTFTVRD